MLAPILLGTLVLGAFGVAPAAARPDAEAAACRPGWTSAVIAGKRVCLRAGQACRRALDRQYHRYRFHCHTGRLTRFPPPAQPPREPTVSVRVLGPETGVFGTAADPCPGAIVPDTSPRALRDADGTVHLYVSTRRRLSGPSLESLEPTCERHMESFNDPRPSWYDDDLLPTGFYTDDGRTVFALVQNVHQGHRYPGQCPAGSFDRCMWTSVTLAVSTDGGRSFARPYPPAHLVATLPTPYVPDVGPAGVFTGTSIVRNPEDGHYYAAYRQIANHLGAHRGTCLMRTNNLADARSWRAWDGLAFSVSFPDPYREPVGDAYRHLCSPVFGGGFDTMGESLVWSTYLERWVLVGTGNHGRAGGFYFSTSRDLRHWSPVTLILRGELSFTYECGDPEPFAYGSLLDPASESRNFHTVGERPYLYFVRMRYEGCAWTGRSDVVRVPLGFTKSP